MNFTSKVKPKYPEKKKEKGILKNLYALFDDRESVLGAFDGRIFGASNRIISSAINDKIDE